MAERLALVAALDRRAALGERQRAVGDRVGHLIQRRIRQVVDVVARLVIALVVRDAGGSAVDGRLSGS